MEAFCRVSFAAYCLPPTVCRLLSAACCLPPTLSACPSLSAPAACLCYQARFASRLLPPLFTPPGAESGLFAGIRSRCASSPAFFGQFMLLCPDELLFARRRLSSTGAISSPFRTFWTRRSIALTIEGASGVGALASTLIPASRAAFERTLSEDGDGREPFGSGELLDEGLHIRRGVEGQQVVLLHLEGFLRSLATVRARITDRRRV